MDYQPKRRVAFLFNSNARSVTPLIKNKLERLIPPQDLYFSHDKHESVAIINGIIDKGYTYLFCGGGDGTVAQTINVAYQRSLFGKNKETLKIGVLRLGTGNALARFLKAKDYEQDIRHILSGKTFFPVSVNMVETEEHALTPFAGIGYDGEIVNDFQSIKDMFVHTPFRKVFTSFFGFTLAGVFKTLPRQFLKEDARVIIKTTSEAYRMIREQGRDEEVYVSGPTVIYDGPAPLICIGTIPMVGYDFKMFPFALRRPGYMQLRICAVPLAVCLSHFYPSIWQGTFRHPKLLDYLVKDITIESDKSLPYQSAGDAMGHKKSLAFNISQNPVEMVALDDKVKPSINISKPLLMPLF